MQVKGEYILMNCLILPSLLHSLLQSAYRNMFRRLAMASMNDFTKNSSLFLLLCFCCCYFKLYPLLLLPVSANTAAALPSEVKSWSGNKVPEAKRSRVLRASEQDHSDPESTKIYVSIYNTAFTRTYNVNPGPIFIRLHFYPISDPYYNISKALFSVSAGSYTLLRTYDFSYFQHIVVKEYLVNIDGRILNITFTPSRHIADAYAFVNKIDVLPLPSNPYLQENASISIVGHASNPHIQKSMALETMYRLNIGGHYTSGEHDSGMLRAWSEDDDDFLVRAKTDTAILQSEVKIRYSSQVSEYTAPEEVYATARTIIPNNYGALPDNLTMTWSFPVESGFCYLIRLHFCEIGSSIERDQRVFRIYINNHNVEDRVDVIHWSGGAGVPVFKDYVANFSGDSSREGIASLFVAIQSNKRSRKPLLQAILNGMEIIKISDTSNSLAGSSPFEIFRKGSIMEENVRREVQIAKGIFYGLASIFTLASCLPFLFWLRHLAGRIRTSFAPKSLESSGKFSLAEMKLATDNFSDCFLIGAGGFGKVYKGLINGGAATVAIKRASATSNQGLKEFQTEISMLSKLRHCHLVSLVGYCMEKKEMILVYDYMSRGTLKDHLYKTDKPPLSWTQRLKIAIGAARGLHYLHTGTGHTIIHRDIKSTNILLDKNWEAKVSDFGLSNVITQSKTHVTTVVKGSFGYLDPEYYRRQKLTEKSDVYSFGVVLFEVLCARPAMIPMGELEEEEHEKVNLAEWAVHCCQMGTLDQIIDPYLRGKISPECLETYTNIARKCLKERGTDRPSMGDVLWNLEMALREQQGSDLEEGSRASGETNRRLSSCLPAMIDGKKCLQIGNSDPNQGVEFSEIMVPRER